MKKLLLAALLVLAAGQVMARDVIAAGIAWEDTRATIESTYPGSMVGTSSIVTLNGKAPYYMALRYDSNGKIIGGLIHGRRGMSPGVMGAYFEMRHGEGIWNNGAEVWYEPGYTLIFYETVEGEARAMFQRKGYSDGFREWAEDILPKIPS